MPANSAGDLVLHGNWPYLNLLEGNIVAHIVIDDSHGKNGTYNTVFRNRVELYGIFMNNAPASPNQNIVGNEITNQNPIMGYYVITGFGHFQHGNNVRGTIMPGGTNNLPEASLYLQAAPQYYQDQNSWPPIGIPNSLNSHKNKAEYIFDEGYLTTCEANVVTATFDSHSDEMKINVYPNPALNTLNIELGSGLTDVLEWTLIEPSGKILKTGDGHVVDLSDVSIGLFFLQIFDEDLHSTTKRIIKVSY